MGNEPLPWVNIIYGDERDKLEEMDNQGIKYLQEGKFAEAEKIYLELCSKSDNPIYFYNLGCVYSREGIKKKL